MTTGIQNSPEDRETEREQEAGRITSDDRQYIEKIEKQSRRPRNMELLLTGLVRGAAISIPLTVVGMPWILENLPILAAVKLAALVVGVIAAALIHVYRRRLLQTMGLRADVELGYAVSRLVDLARHLTSEDRSRAARRVVSQSVEMSSGRPMTRKPACVKAGSDVGLQLHLPHLLPGDQVG